MNARVVLAVVLGMSPVLGGCGGAAPPPEPEACAPADPAPDVAAGAMLRQAQGAVAFEVLPVTGRLGRDARVEMVEAGGHRVRVGPARDGAGPVAALAAETGAASLVELAFRQGEVPFVARAVAGAPTPGSLLPTAGRARYEGKVEVALIGAGGAARRLEGEAALEVRFATGEVGLTLGGLRAAAVPDAAVPAVADEAAGDASSGEAAAGDMGGLPAVAGLGWAGLGICGTRIGSTGRGAFRARGADGAPVPLAGAARLEAGFFGHDAARGAPAAVGGVFVIQGDAGAVAGLFVGALAE